MDFNDINSDQYMAIPKNNTWNPDISFNIRSVLARKASRKEPYKP